MSSSQSQIRRQTPKTPDPVGDPEQGSHGLVPVGPPIGIKVPNKVVKTDCLAREAVKSRLAPAGNVFVQAQNLGSCPLEIKLDEGKNGVAKVPAGQTGSIQGFDVTEARIDCAGTTRADECKFSYTILWR